jgi:thiol:disulfide interchange protein DsbD
MERFKQLLAFPLYATVAWLVWVVSRQAGPEGVAVALAGIVLIAFAVWLRRVSRQSRTTWRRGATVVATALVVAAVALAPVAGAVSIMNMGASIWPPYPQTLGRRGGATSSSTAGWEPFTPKRLAELRAAGTPVFVNFTAAWCITCLVNERVALRSTAVTTALAQKGVATLKADWTKQDPMITDVLGTFGRNGVPLYLFYPARRGNDPAGQPVVLPQILSEGIVIDAIQ